MSPIQVAVAWLAIAAGAYVQGGAGFGSALLAAPILLLVAPDFVPAPIITAGIVLNLLVVRRDHLGFDLRGSLVPLAGAVPGSMAGAALVARLSKSALELVFGLLILSLVVLSALGPARHPTRRVLFGAGMLSGLSGTATSVGGPPVALALQHEPGIRLRATLAAFFVGSSLVSLASLTAFGALTGRDLLLGALLVPAEVVGFSASSHAVRLLDRGRTRHAVLVISSISAAVVLARAVF